MRVFNVTIAYVSVVLVFVGGAYFDNSYQGILSFAGPTSAIIFAIIFFYIVTLYS